VSDKFLGLTPCNIDTCSLFLKDASIAMITIEWNSASPKFSVEYKGRNLRVLYTWNTSRSWEDLVLEFLNIKNEFHAENSILNHANETRRETLPRIDEVITGYFKKIDYKKGNTFSGLMDSDDEKIIRITGNVENLPQEGTRVYVDGHFRNSIRGREFFFRNYDFSEVVELSSVPDTIEKSNFKLEKGQKLCNNCDSVLDKKMSRCPNCDSTMNELYQFIMNENKKDVFIDKDVIKSLTKSQLDKMYRKFKKDFPHLSNGDDVRDMFSKIVDRMGGTWNVEADVWPDHHKVIVSVLSSVKKERTEESKIFEKAKRKFGVTNNYNIAGYILPDGSMLNFGGYSGARSREADHREINVIFNDEGDRNDGMNKFIEMGAVRMHISSGDMFIDFRKELTRKQESVIYNAPVESYTVDFKNNGSYRYKEYDRKKHRLMFMEMREYIKTGKVPEGVE
jgi:succinate dehydrogenase flavin-adding protein (antitoxin of CptAB toxin-antitoxin module)